MKNVIKRIINLFYPEIASGKHLPVFAVVTSVPDASTQNNISDPYRPYYAVNLRLLNESLKIDESIAEIEGVPVSMNGAGVEKGSIELPQPGVIVEIAYAYGKQSLMFVRSAMPFRLSLANYTSDSVRLQQDWTSYIEIDRAGNNNRITNADINDDSLNHTVDCVNKMRAITNELSDIKGVSHKKIHGIYKRIAGAIKLLTTGSASYGAAFNINITAGQDINEAVGNNLNAKIGKNYQLFAGESIHLSNNKIIIKLEANGDLSVSADKNINISSKDATVKANNIKLDGGIVDIGATTTIDKRAFLGHTHQAGSYTTPIGGNVSGSSGVVV